MAQNDGRQVAEGIRGAIIAYHGRDGMNFAQIGRMDGIGLGRKTCSNIWHTAMHSAQIALQTDEVLPWHVIIKYTKAQDRPGAPKKVNPRDKTKLRQAFLDNPYDTFPEVAEAQCLDISANTAYALAREPSPVHPKAIVKMSVPHKLWLDPEKDPPLRIDYSKWL